MRHRSHALDVFRLAGGGKAYEAKLLFSRYRTGPDHGPDPPPMGHATHTHIMHQMSATLSQAGRSISRAVPSALPAGRIAKTESDRPIHT